MTAFRQAAAAARELDRLSVRGVGGWLPPSGDAEARGAWDAAWLRLRSTLALDGPPEAPGAPEPREGLTGGSSAPALSALRSLAESHPLGGMTRETLGEIAASYCPSAAGARAMLEARDLMEPAR